GRHAERCDARGNRDDEDAGDDARQHVAERQPQSAEYEPDDVEQQSHAPDDSPFGCARPPAAFSAGSSADRSASSPLMRFTTTVARPSAWASTRSPSMAASSCPGSTSMELRPGP